MSTIGIHFRAGDRSTQGQHPPLHKTPKRTPLTRNQVPATQRNTTSMQLQSKTYQYSPEMEGNSRNSGDFMSPNSHSRVRLNHTRTAGVHHAEARQWQEAGQAAVCSPAAVGVGLLGQQRNRREKKIGH